MKSIECFVILIALMEIVKIDVSGKRSDSTVRMGSKKNISSSECGHWQYQRYSSASLLGNLYKDGYNWSSDLNLSRILQLATRNYSKGPGCSIKRVNPNSNSSGRLYRVVTESTDDEIIPWQDYRLPFADVPNVMEFPVPPMPAPLPHNHWEPPNMFLAPLLNSIQVGPRCMNASKNMDNCEFGSKNLKLTSCLSRSSFRTTATACSTSAKCPTKIRVFTPRRLRKSTSCSTTGEPCETTTQPCTTTTPCKTTTFCQTTTTPCKTTTKPCQTTTTPCQTTTTPCQTTTTPCQTTTTPCQTTTTPCKTTTKPCQTTTTPCQTTTTPCQTTTTPCQTTTTPCQTTTTPCKPTTTPCKTTTTPCQTTTRPCKKTIAPCQRTTPTCKTTTVPCGTTTRLCVKRANEKSKTVVRRRLLLKRQHLGRRIKEIQNSPFLK